MINEFIYHITDFIARRNKSRSRFYFKQTQEHEWAILNFSLKKRFIEI